MASKLSTNNTQVSVKSSCSLCDTIQDVNWYCNDCQEALCEKCKECHKRGKKTQEDNVVPITELNKKVTPNHQEVCKTHPGKSYDLYCCDCNIVMCTMCFTEKHKQHTFKHMKDEIDSRKHYLFDQLKTLRSMFDHFNENLSNRHEVSKSFKEIAEVIRIDVENQRLKLKAEVDSLTESVLTELSSLVAEEEKSHNQDCQIDERNVIEIKKLITDVEQEAKKLTCETPFELTGKQRIATLLYDVAAKRVLPRPPHFVSGQLNLNHLKTMIGYLVVDKLEVLGYEKKEIDNHHVQHISRFRVPQKRQVNSICAIDESHAWVLVHGSEGLIQFNKQGKVTDTIPLDFKPWCLTLANDSELLITCQGDSPMIYKLSNDRQVTVFADISPMQAWDTGVDESGEIFVSTRTQTILVLNSFGNIVRQINCGQNVLSIVCLTGGMFAFATGRPYNCKELFIIDKRGQILYKWGGELDNGTTLSKIGQCNIARDMYDRVFVPDFNTKQVYVITGEGRNPRCLLDKNHGVIRALAVCVDKCGHVWLGCSDGRVHVMQL